MPSLWAAVPSTCPHLYAKTAEDWQAVRKGLSSRSMYLDEQDALRPVSTKPSSSRAAWLGGGAVLLLVIAGGLVAALTAEDDEAPVATALESDAPAVAPRSQGEIVAATPTPPVAPAPSQDVAVAPAPAAMRAVVAPTTATNPATAAPHNAGASTRGSAEADLLQQLSERAGELADTRKPAAPELDNAPPAAEPSGSPELEDEPAPPPLISPELNDEPPLD